MKSIIPCELRDLDGSYLLFEPVGESRCRILASNVAPKGQLLYKPTLLSWAQATKDLGGYTRLSPAELLAQVDPKSVADPESLVEALATHEEILSGPRTPDPAGEVVDQATLPRQDGNLEADDPRAELLRRAIHDRKPHVRKGRKNRSAEVA